MINFEDIQFGLKDMVRICVNVVLGAVFVIMMKSDIAGLKDGLSELKSDNKEDRGQNKAWQTKVEAEYGEMKVRVSILEQKVTNLEIARDEK